MSTQLRNFVENIQSQLKDHANLVNAHDTIHPNRSDCGGVGGCALLRAEHDAEVSLVEALRLAARKGFTVTAAGTE